MGGANTELSGPDFGAGVDIGQVPEGVPLLGHAAGEAIVVVRRGEWGRSRGSGATRAREQQPTSSWRTVQSDPARMANRRLARGGAAAAGPARTNGCEIGLRMNAPGASMPRCRAG